MPDYAKLKIDVDFKDFARVIGRYKDRGESVMRRSLIEMSARAYERTPVDTGSLQASWTPGIGRAVARNVNLGSKASEGGASAGSNDAVSVINRLKVGETFYYSNGQPHAMACEYGHSSQAPRGMMRISVAEFPAIVREQIRRAS